MLRLSNNTGYESITDTMRGRYSRGMGTDVNWVGPWSRYYDLEEAV